VFDYTWKQNRLSKDKEALKAQMLGILKKNPKNDKQQQNDKEGREGGEAEPTISELAKKKF